MKAEQGKLLSVTTGEYSDYFVIGFFVVLEDFDPMLKLDEYFDLNPTQKEDYGFDSDQFLSFLLKAGLLLKIDFSYLHLGAYHTGTGQKGVKFFPKKQKEGGE